MRYIPAARHGGPTNFPIKRIVMHGTVSPCLPGDAYQVAEMFAHSTRDASTQFVVDPGEVIRCVPDGVVAYGAPPNTGEIHVEQCDMQYARPTPTQRKRWQDVLHQQMLHRSAQLVAGLCVKYSIPIVKLSYLDLRAGKKGICGHADVSAAWHLTTHTDPGPDYPWTQFIALVKAYAHPAPTPTPAPAGDEMRARMYFDSAAPTPRPVYIGDGITKRWVVNPDDFHQVVQQMVQDGYPAWYLAPHATSAVAVASLGVTIGPVYSPAVHGKMEDLSAFAVDD